MTVLVIPVQAGLGISGDVQLTGSLTQKATTPLAVSITLLVTAAKPSAVPGEQQRFRGNLATIKVLHSAEVVQVLLNSPSPAIKTSLLSVVTCGLGTTTRTSVIPTALSSGH